MTFFLKDPGASLDYSVDWGAYYLNGTTIAASTWAVEPQEPGGVAVIGSIAAPTRTGATLSGGAPGKLYRVTNHVTLSSGRSDERAIALRVEDR